MTQVASRQEAKAELLIRKPVPEVFSAFVDEGRITQFWLSGTSGPLVPGARVRWDFMVSGACDEIEVRTIVVNSRIVFGWSDGSIVELLFDEFDGGTRIAVTQTGFTGPPSEIVARAVETTQGFTLVLCDLKTLLETGKSCNIVRDKAALIQAGRRSD